MEVYAFAISGSSHAINAHTVEMYSNVVNVGKRILSHYEDLRSGDYKDHWNDNQNVSRGQSFERFVKSYRSFRIYIADVDSRQKWKKLSGSKVWNMLLDEPEFKPQIVKMMLRS